MKNLYSSRAIFLKWIWLERSSALTML